MFAMPMLAVRIKQFWLEPCGCIKLTAGFYPADPDQVWVNDCAYSHPWGLFVSGRCRRSVFEHGDRHGSCNYWLQGTLYWMHYLWRYGDATRSNRWWCIPTREEVRCDVFDYIEMFYSSKRKHGSHNLLLPVECGNRYQERLGSTWRVSGDLPIPTMSRIISLSIARISKYWSRGVFEPDIRPIDSEKRLLMLWRWRHQSNRNMVLMPDRARHRLRH